MRAVFAAPEAATASARERARAKAAGKTDDEAEALAEQASRDAVHTVDWKDQMRPLSGRELSTEKIVAALVEMEDRPWPEMPSRRGAAKPLTTAGFTRMIKPFGVQRKNLVFGSNQRAWGYRAPDFVEAWNRHLDA